jgi:riboflavin kinase / FMN adenylyltransferase
VTGGEDAAGRDLSAPAHPVVVIGNFDGVHLGHQHLLAVARQARPDAELVAVTFEPHTLAVLRPDLAPRRLTSPARKQELLAQAGVDRTVVVPFTHDTTTWPPELFIERVLRPLEPAAVVVGDGFRFGHRASGNAKTLAAAGFDVREVDLTGVVVHGHQAPVSSSSIRYALDAGDVESAAAMLGRPHRVDGTVIRGDQRGRALLGFPTANLPVDPAEATPADGVYAGWLTRLDPLTEGRQPAAISVGSNPTFDGVQRRVESYVLDRDDLMLYGVQVAVEFTRRIRGQVKFDSIEALVVQMRADVDEIRTLLLA